MSAGVASNECGSAVAPVSIDLTDACSPATALATLPHTSVVATTLTAPWSSTGRILAAARGGERGHRQPNRQPDRRPAPPTPS